MLTAKRKAFAQAVADGLSQADAYRAAFDADGMSAGAVWTEASLLARNPQVAQRIGELKAEADDVRQIMLVGREHAILAQIEFEAFNARSDASRLKALELLGRAAGLFVDRLEVQQVDRTADDLETAIRERLAQHVT